jgi:hypothetical protein
MLIIKTILLKELLTLLFFFFLIIIIIIINSLPPIKKRVNFVGHHNKKNWETLYISTSSLYTIV